MCLLQFLIYTMYMYQSDVQLLPSPLFGNIYLLWICCVYLRQIVHLKHIMWDSCVSPVTTAYTGSILFGKTSPTNSLITKNVFDGAKRRLVTHIEKREPITPDMLLKLYNSVFKENNLMSQRIISSCLLAFAEFLHVSDFRILLCDFYS